MGTANGEKGHKLNFPDDHAEVCPEQKTNYFGVSYNEKHAKWCACRYSKNEKKTLYNGTHKDEKLAAHASDTLARKLTANGEKSHKLNFPDDLTEVYPEQKTNYFGVSYNKLKATWDAYRYSRNEKRNVYNGTCKNEVTAAHASDTLARKLIDNGEKGHKLNFPDDHTEVYPEQKNNYFGVSYSAIKAKWQVER